jgi:hypothetical protein
MTACGFRPRLKLMSEFNYDAYFFIGDQMVWRPRITLSVDKDYSKQYVTGLKEMIATLHIYQR